MKDFFDMKESLIDKTTGDESFLVESPTVFQADPAPQTVDLSVTNVKRMRSQSVEMFLKMTNHNWTEAEEILLEIVENALLAHQARQGDAEKIAEEALKAIKTYRHYQTL